MWKQASRTLAPDSRHIMNSINDDVVMKVNREAENEARETKKGRTAQKCEGPSGWNRSTLLRSFGISVPKAFSPNLNLDPRSRAFLGRSPVKRRVKQCLLPMMTKPLIWFGARARLPM
jgi:hypothetical protein